MQTTRNERDHRRPGAPGLVFALIMAPLAAVLAVGLLLIAGSGRFSVLGLAVAPLVVFSRVGARGMSSDRTAALAVLSTIVVPLVFAGLAFTMALAYGFFMQSFN